METDFEQQFIHTATTLFDYSPKKTNDLKVQCLQLLDTPSLTIAALKKALTIQHIKAVTTLLEKSNISAKKLNIIGAHGQTLYHNPAKKISLQLLDWNLLQAHFNIPVIGAFRQNDIDHGGQGAPLAPVYHWAMTQRDQLEHPIAIINCGGIANLTYINSTLADQLIAFDTGPGNILLDRWVRQQTHGIQLIDLNGQFSMHGRIDRDLLSKLHDTVCTMEGINYFNEGPPKALDARQFDWKNLMHSVSLNDGCATLAAFTAETIVNSLTLIPHYAAPKTWVLAGGGWHNPAIYQNLLTKIKTLYPDSTVKLADDIGWQGDTLEAEIFAYLAVRCLNNKPISYPGTTGVPAPVTGGCCFK